LASHVFCEYPSTSQTARGCLYTPVLSEFWLVYHQYQLLSHFSVQTVFSQIHHTIYVVPCYLCLHLLASSVGLLDLSYRSSVYLILNHAKSKEIIFRAHGVHGANSQLPNPIDGIERVHKITALGIIVNDQLTSTDHVSSLLSSCSSLLYALRLLRDHGLPTISLHGVFRATVVSKILYCALVWYSFSSPADLNKLESFPRCCKRSGYCKLDMPTITEQMDDANNSVFLCIIANKHHVLQ